MIEIIGFIVGAIALGIALVGLLAATGALAALAGLLLFGLACIGWMPILACAIYEHYEIGGNTFTGQLAMAAMWLYLALSAIIIIIGFTVEDPDNIPPAYKFLALFYRHPADGKNLRANPSAYVASVSETSGNRHWSRVQARKLDQMAKDSEAKAEHSAAAARVLKAQEELARAKAMEEALRRKSK